MPGKYGNNVFVNAPFDGGYTPVFEAIIFAISDCGYLARCAKEGEDGGQTRIDKLYKIIGDCRFGVHDISRTQLDAKNKLPRFNMPFELGLFLGAKSFGDGKHRRKICLVLDKLPYRYQKFISDISGQDVQDHRNDPKIVIKKIRNWISNNERNIQIPSAGIIANRYAKFCKDLPRFCRQKKLNKSELTFNDFRQLTAIWQKANPW